MKKSNISKYVSKESAKLQTESPLKDQKRAKSFSTSPKPSPTKSKNLSPRTPFTHRIGKIPRFDEVLEQVEKETIPPDRAAIMNPRILENWINNTLLDAEHLEIPGCIALQESIQPLTRYGMDRPTLMAAGVTSQQVDAIFRALFVYTVGFHMLIKRISEQCEDKYKCVAGVWKVFAILLEYSWHIDYDMMIQDVSIKNQHHIEQLEKIFEEKIGVLEKKVQSQEKDITSLRSEVEASETLRLTEQQARMALQEEARQRGTGYEFEVELRLKFESRLNYLYAQQNDNEKKILYVKDELKRTEGASRNKGHELKEVKGQFLKTEQQLGAIEIDHKVMTDENLKMHRTISMLNDKIDSFTTEVLKLKTRVSDYQSESQTLKQEIVEKQLIIDRLTQERYTFESEYHKYSSRVSGFKANIQKLQNRIKHLESNQKEKDQDHSHFKQETVAVIENESFLQEQVQTYKTRCDYMEQKSIEDMEKLDKIILDYEMLENKHETLTKEMRNQMQLIDEVTKARRKAEDNDLSQHRLIEELKRELLSKHRDFMKIKKETTADANHVDDLNRQIRNIQVDKQTSKQLSKTKLRTLKDRIQGLNHQIELEREHKDVWKGKYDNESAAHMEIRQKYLESKARGKELLAHLNSIQAKIDDQDQEIRNERSRIEDIRKKLAGSEFDKQKAVRKNATKKTLLKIQAESHAKELKEIRFKKNIEEKEQQLFMEKFRMAKEDIHTRCYALLKKLGNANNSNEISRRKIENQAKAVDKLKEQNRRLKNELDEVKEDLHENKARVVLFEEKNTVLESEKIELKEAYADEYRRNQLLEAKIIIKPSELKKLKKKLKKAEDKLEEKKARGPLVAEKETQTQGLGKDAAVQTKKGVQMMERRESKISSTLSPRSIDRRGSNTEFFKPQANRRATQYDKLGQNLTPSTSQLVPSKSKQGLNAYGTGQTNQRVTRRAVTKLSAEWTKLDQDTLEPLYVNAQTSEYKVPSRATGLGKKLSIHINQQIPGHTSLFNSLAEDNAVRLPRADAGRSISPVPESFDDNSLNQTSPLLSNTSHVSIHGKMEHLETPLFTVTTREIDRARPGRMRRKGESFRVVPKKSPVRVQHSRSVTPTRKVEEIQETSKTPDIKSAFKQANSRLKDNFEFQ